MLSGPKHAFLQESYYILFFEFIEINISGAFGTTAFHVSCPEKIDQNFLSAGCGQIGGMSCFCARIMTWSNKNQMSPGRKIL
jgi:hypothetical protein